MLTLCYTTLEMVIDFLHLNLKYLFIVVLCKLAWLFLLNVEMYQLNPLNNLSAHGVIQGLITCVCLLSRVQ